MKKFIFSLALITLALFHNTGKTQAFSVGDFQNGMNKTQNALGTVQTGINSVNNLSNSISNFPQNFKSNPLNSVDSVIGGIGGVVGDISQTTKDIGGIINLGVGIVSDFEDMWDTIEGGGVGPDGKFVLPDSEEFKEIGANTSLRQFILNVLNFALSFLGLIATSAVIYSGFMYVTAAGDDGQIEKSKKVSTYSVIGIIVILASFALVNTVIQNAGTGGDDRDGATTAPTPTDPNDPDKPTVPVPNDIFNFQNGIKVSGGSQTQDLGKIVVASAEDALAGLNLGLTLKSNAIFDFGDGTQGLLDTINNPDATLTRTFGEGKIYPIRVIAQSADGSIYSFQKKLVIGGTTAQFSKSKTTALINENISLDASQSAAVVGSITKYNWTCTGGNGCFPNTNGKTISASFAEPGNYTVTLEVENALGMKDKTSQNITIIGDKPVANFVFETGRNPDKPMFYVFDASESKNISNQNENLLYRWKIDGQRKETYSPFLEHEFQTEGSRSISLVVIQIFDGKKLFSDETTQNIKVTSTLPVEFNVFQ